MVRVFVGDPRAILNWPKYCRTNRYFEEELHDRDHAVRMHENLMGVCVFKVEKARQQFGIYSVASNGGSTDYLTGNGLGAILILRCEEFLQGEIAGKAYDHSESPIGPAMHALISTSNNAHAYHFLPRKDLNRIVGFPDLLGPVTLQVSPKELKVTGRSEIVVSRS